MYLKRLKTTTNHAAAHAAPVLLPFHAIKRDGTPATILPHDLRSLRRSIAQNHIFLHNLPYTAATINAIFPWKPAPITDADLSPLPVQAPSPVPKVINVATKIPTTTPAVKLSLAIARDIRSGIYGTKASQIATSLNIGESTARDILKGRTWKDSAVTSNQVAAICQ